MMFTLLSYGHVLTLFLSIGSYILIRGQGLNPNIYRKWCIHYDG